MTNFKLTMEIKLIVFIKVLVRNYIKKRRTRGTKQRKEMQTNNVSNFRSLTLLNSISVCLRSNNVMSGDAPINEHHILFALQNKIQFYKNKKMKIIRVLLAITL